MDRILSFPDKRFNANFMASSDKVLASFRKLYKEKANLPLD
jgi:hypothetical protein